MQPGSAIRIINGNFGWAPNEFSLKDLSATVPGSALTIVVGPIASGKSTLCKALLGETPSFEGRVVLNSNHRRIGYCDQTLSYPTPRYAKTLLGSPRLTSSDTMRSSKRPCCLGIYPCFRRATTARWGGGGGGGSNGITLSGGQKQRVSVARALYLESDLLIFDDILSGLDADTEEAVFNSRIRPAGNS